MNRPVLTAIMTGQSINRMKAHNTCLLLEREGD